MLDIGFCDIFVMAEIEKIQLMDPEIHQPFGFVRCLYCNDHIYFGGGRVSSCEQQQVDWLTYANLVGSRTKSNGLLFR